MSTRDKVTLSARERQELAKLQSMLETADPELAKKLGRRQHGRRNAPGHLALVLRHRLSLLGEHRWLGPVLVVIGLGLTLAAVGSTVWLGIPGALVAAVGLVLGFSAVQGIMADRAAGTARPGGEDSPSS